MDLVTKLSNPPASQPIGKSSIDIWADTLTVAEREAVYDAASNTDWGHVALRDLLAAEGAPLLSDNAFRSWRVKQGWHRGA